MGRLNWLGGQDVETRNHDRWSRCLSRSCGSTPPTPFVRPRVRPPPRSAPPGGRPRAGRRRSVTMLAADGSLLTPSGALSGQPLMLKEMPPPLPRAVTAIEDRRFYSHFGVAPLGLVRALFANIAAGHIVQGG